MISHLTLVEPCNENRQVETALRRMTNAEMPQPGRSASLHVRRAKKGKRAVHPIRGDELRMLTALRKEYPDNAYVFTTERGSGQRARLPLPVHFHMLRHSCGYKLANDGIPSPQKPGGGCPRERSIPWTPPST